MNLFPKTLLLGFAVLIAGPAWAQPAIDSRFDPIAGTRGLWRLNSITDPALQVQPATGANRVWDYSSIYDSASAEVNRISVLPNASAGNGDIFSQSNFIWNMGDSARSFPFYVKNNSAGLALVGLGNADTANSSTYTDLYERPYLFLPRGLNFGDTYRDSVGVRYYGRGSRTDTRNSYSITYVGYGSLIVKGRRIDNVVLMKDTRKEYSTQNGELSYIYNYYRWYSQDGFGIQIAEWMDETDGQQTSHIYKFFFMDDVVTAINAPATSGHLRISPNPARNTLILAQAGMGTISTLAGQKIQTFSGSRIDVASLSPGLYFLTLDTPQGPVTQRFLKE